MKNILYSILLQCILLKLSNCYDIIYNLIFSLCIFKKSSFEIFGKALLRVILVFKITVATKLQIPGNKGGLRMVTVRKKVIDVQKIKSTP